VEDKVLAFYLSDNGFAPELKIPYSEKRVVSVKNMTTGEKIPFKIREGCVTVTLDSSAPAPSADYGGEFIAEVFELAVERQVS
jgi:hypothetical protein